ncbi:MAG: hypothetical protein AAFX87_13560 [Bacteroidota bacterium]
MSKFKRFIERAKDSNDSLKKAIDVAENGWGTFKDLAGKHNKIAQWCGLPAVPEVLSK